MTTILLRGLPLAVIAAAGWALACNGGDVLSVEPSPQPGDLGSRESPIAFGSEVEWGSLRIEVDRWELIKCPPSQVTPTPSGEECPEGPYKDRIVRFFVTVRNVSDGRVSGPIQFFLVFDSQAYPNLFLGSGDESLPGAGPLAPRETIEGWVYSVRPDLGLWQEPGRVLLQTSIGQSALLSEGGLFWDIPAPPPSDLPEEDTS